MAGLAKSEQALAQKKRHVGLLERQARLATVQGKAEEKLALMKRKLQHDMHECTFAPQTNWSSPGQSPNASRSSPTNMKTKAKAKTNTQARSTTAHWRERARQRVERPVVDRLLAAGHAAEEKLAREQAQVANDDLRACKNEQGNMFVPVVIPVTPEARRAMQQVS